MAESITCPSCGRTISGAMPTCPGCGAALASSTSPTPGSSSDLPRWPAPYPSQGGGFDTSSSQQRYVTVADGEPLTDFGAPLARWSQRVGSMLIDLLILVVPYFILSAICTSAFGHYAYVHVGSKTVHTKVLSAGGSDALRLLFILAWAVYMTVLNGLGTGQTPGNRALRIAVRDLSTGEVIGPTRGFVRWLVRFVLYLVFVVPGIVNDLFPLWDRRRQSIADKAARSVVVRV